MFIEIQGFPSLALLFHQTAGLQLGAWGGGREQKDPQLREGVLGGPWSFSKGGWEERSAAAGLFHGHQVLEWHRGAPGAAPLLQHWGCGGRGAELNVTPAHAEPGHAAFHYPNCLSRSPAAVLG